MNFVINLRLKFIKVSLILLINKSYLNWIISNFTNVNYFMKYVAAKIAVNGPVINFVVFLFFVNAIFAVFNSFNLDS